MHALFSIAFKNLRHYKGRTLALVLFSTLMALSLFVGVLLVRGMQSGLSLTRARLGADLLIIPESAGSTVQPQTILTQAEPGYFYMDQKKLEEIAALDGIERLSPQLFLASSKSSCCSSRLQIIAYDPETDFTISPWIEHQYGALGYMDLFVGSNVAVYDDLTLRLYDRTCHVSGQFAPTGSSMDNAVYMNFDTVKALIQASFEKGLNRYQTFNADDYISAVLIQVQKDHDVADVQRAIQENVKGVIVIPASSLLSGISGNVEVLSGTLTPIVVALVLLSFGMILFLFLLEIYERRHEFASLSVLGANQGQITSLLLSETLLVDLIACIPGLLLPLLLLYSFRTALQSIIGNGFILPDSLQVMLTAAFALLLMLLSAGLSALFGSLLLKRNSTARYLKEVV
ncbi:MAG: FtsX-like permease family protein [Clostridia bacterium]|nr:FtsX-like permease family protein [Clostridia bacterium]